MAGISQQALIIVYLFAEVVLIYKNQARFIDNLYQHKANIWKILTSSCRPLVCELEISMRYIICALS